MKTFYDFRETDFINPDKHPLEGRVILKRKDWWLLWISKNNPVIEQGQPIKGFIVAPRSIYLYNVYIAKSFWDALRYFIKSKDKCKAPEVK